MDEILDSIYIGGICVLAAAIALILVGFGCNGISANSCAASMQSCYGNVSGGSCFSTLHSLGAKGYFVGVVIVLGLLYLVGEFGKSTYRNYMKEYVDNISNSTNEWTHSIAYTAHDWTDTIANTTHVLSDTIVNTKNEWTQSIANSTNELAESLNDFINGEKEKIQGNTFGINKLNSSERKFFSNSTILTGNIDIRTPSSPDTKKSNP
jgi:hypothetical protein